MAVVDCALVCMKVQAMRVWWLFCAFSLVRFECAICAFLYAIFVWVYGGGAVGVEKDGNGDGEAQVVTDTIKPLAVCMLSLSARALCIGVAFVCVCVRLTVHACLSPFVCALECPCFPVTVRL